MGMDDTISHPEVHTLPDSLGLSAMMGLGGSHLSACLSTRSIPASAKGINDWLPPMSAGASASQSMSTIPTTSRTSSLAASYTGQSSLSETAWSKSKITAWHSGLNRKSGLGFTFGVRVKGCMIDSLYASLACQHGPSVGDRMVSSVIGRLNDGLQ